MCVDCTILKDCLVDKGREGKGKGMLKEKLKTILAGILITTIILFALFMWVINGIAEKNTEIIERNIVQKYTSYENIVDEYNDNEKARIEIYKESPEGKFVKITKDDLSVRFYIDKNMNYKKL